MISLDTGVARQVSITLDFPAMACIAGFRVPHLSLVADDRVYLFLSYFNPPVWSGLHDLVVDIVTLDGIYRGGALVGVHARFVEDETRENVKDAGAELIRDVWLRFQLYRDMATRGRNEIENLSRAPERRRVRGTVGV